MTETDSGLPNFDALWDFAQPGETRGRFEALLQEHGATAPLEWRLGLITQIARTLGLERRFDEAHARLDEVDAALVDRDDLPVPRVRSLLERGRAHNSSGGREAARPLFEEAWQLGRECGNDTLAVDAAHMVAIVEVGEAALGWNERALELAEQSDEPGAQRWRGSLFNNIGWTLHDQGRYAEALDLFERALVFREEQGKPGPMRIARWCIARCLRSLERIDEALAIQRALAESAESNDPDGFVEEELGECLLALDRGDEAGPHFARAHALLSADHWLVENEPARIQRLARLGGVKDAESV